MFFQLKVRLNIRISQTGKNHHSVTFSEKQEVYDVIPQGLSRGMSHENVVVIRSYHSHVIFSTNQKRHIFLHKKSSQNVKLFSETSFDL